MMDTKQLVELLKDYEKRELFDVNLRDSSYVTGFIDGFPTIIGHDRPESLRIRFTSDGSFIGYDKTGYPFDVGTESLISLLDLKPDSIRIKGFFIPEMHIGVRALNDVQYDFLANPDTFFEDESEVEPLTTSMEQWVRDLCFVLIWSEEDWINPTMP